MILPNPPQQLAENVVARTEIGLTHDLGSAEGEVFLVWAAAGWSGIKGAVVELIFTTLQDDGPSGGFFRDREPIPW